MDVAVKDGLAGCHTVVHTDVEPIRAEAALQATPYLVNELPQGLVLLRGRLEEAGHVAAWDDERVAFGNRVAQADEFGADEPLNVTASMSALGTVTDSAAGFSW